MLSDLFSHTATHARRILVGYALEGKQFTGREPSLYLPGDSPARASYVGEGRQFRLAPVVGGIRRAEITLSVLISPAGQLTLGFQVLWTNPVGISSWYQYNGVAAIGTDAKDHVTGITMHNLSHLAGRFDAETFSQLYRAQPDLLAMPMANAMSVPVGAEQLLKLANWLNDNPETCIVK